MSFEESLKKLQKNIAALESKETGLSEGVAVFEDGLKNIKACLAALDEAGGKITLIKEELDAILEVPFEDKQ